MNAAKLHETALHHAAKVKNLELVELLVEFGGNIFARDNLGKKPIQYTRSSSASALCLEFYECKFIIYMVTVHNVCIRVRHSLFKDTSEPQSAFRSCLTRTFIETKLLK